MVSQQRNNNKNFPNVFINSVDDGPASPTNVTFSFCHNCKLYFNNAVSSGNGHAYNLELHMITVHGYTDGG